MTLADLDDHLANRRAVQIRIPFDDGLMDSFVRIYHRVRQEDGYRLVWWCPKVQTWRCDGPTFAPREHLLDWLERGSARLVPPDLDAIEEAEALQRAQDDDARRHL